MVLLHFTVYYLRQFLSLSKNRSKTVFRLFLCCKKFARSFRNKNISHYFQFLYWNKDSNNLFKGFSPYMCFCFVLRENTLQNRLNPLSRHAAGYIMQDCACCTATKVTLTFNISLPPQMTKRKYEIWNMK